MHDTCLHDVPGKTIENLQKKSPVEAFPEHTGDTTAVDHGPRQECAHETPPMLAGKQPPDEVQGLNSGSEQVHDASPVR